MIICFHTSSSLLQLHVVPGTVFITKISSFQTTANENSTHYEGREQRH